MKKKVTISVSVIFCLITSVAFGQQKINLSAEFKSEQVNAVNRVISVYKGSPGAIEMNADEGSGLGILKEYEFKTGVIEIDLLGENAPGQSFIGVAFNIEDAETYEAVYFRPFNFNHCRNHSDRSTDPLQTGRY